MFSAAALAVEEPAGFGGEWPAELDPVLTDPGPVLTDLWQLLELDRELAREIAEMRAAPWRAKCKFFQRVIDATNRRDEMMRAVHARCRPVRAPKPRAWERELARGEGRAT